MKTVLVTGGSGNLGRLVLSILSGRKASGETTEHIAMTSRGGTGLSGVELRQADLLKRSDVETALRGVHTVVHCASKLMPNHDVTMAENVIAAARKHGIEHLVYISIVNIDRMQAFAYYNSKLMVEKRIEDSGLPYTNLRATQFFDLADVLFGILFKLPVALVPKGTDWQPVSVDAVAERLATVALGDAQGRMQDVCGPEMHSHQQLAADWKQHHGFKRPWVSIPLPVEPFKVWRKRAAIPSDAEVIGERWSQWLARQPARAG